MTAHHKAGRPWTRLTVAVFEAAGWRCHHCGRGVHRTRLCPRGGCRLCAQADHWPIGLAEGLARGVPREWLDAPSNLVCACRGCNQGRAGRQSAMARRARRAGANGARRPGPGFFLTSPIGNPPRTTPGSPPDLVPLAGSSGRLTSFRRPAGEQIEMNGVHGRLTGNHG